MACSPPTLPVLMKEMRSRMRGNRTAWLLLTCCGLGVALALVILTLNWPHPALRERVGAYPTGMAEIGSALHLGITLFEGVLVLLLTPALTAGVLTSERERQTYEFLLLTRLSAAGIVAGKLLSALSFLVLLLLCLLPVVTLAFIFGGVSPDQLLGTQGILFAMLLAYGVVGVACSARCPKTSTAVAVAYALCLGYTLYPWLIALSIELFGHADDLLMIHCFLFGVGSVTLALCYGVLRLWRSRLASLLALLPIAAGLAYGFVLLLRAAPSDGIMILFGNPLGTLAMVLNGGSPDSNGDTLGHPWTFLRWTWQPTVPQSHLCAYGALLLIAVLALAHAVRLVREHRQPRG